MKYPTTRFVFDRKNTATKTKPATIYVEVLFERKRMFISTGVKVCKGEWTDKTKVQKRPDYQYLNERLIGIKENVDKYIVELIQKEQAFDWDAFKRFLNMRDQKGETFIEYAKRRIEERNDIKDGTKKNHRKLITSLNEFGKIVDFSDLTRGNIADYYQWLMGKEITYYDNKGNEQKRRYTQQTVASYMKFLRIYIHDAITHDKLAFDPSTGIKVVRGKSREGMWLTEQEYQLMRDSEMSTYSLKKARDLFIFMSETGMAHSDAMSFNFKEVELRNDGLSTYTGNRVKTGNKFFFVLTEKAMEILREYKFRLPKFANQTFNNTLKKVAKELKIDKPISSHYARRTCGYRLLNKGVSIEIVAKVLGHSSTRTTEEAYAKILNSTVVDAFKEHIL